MLNAIRNGDAARCRAASHSHYYNLVVGILHESLSLPCELISSMSDQDGVKEEDSEAATNPGVNSNISDATATLHILISTVARRRRVTPTESEKCYRVLGRNYCYRTSKNVPCRIPVSYTHLTLPTNREV